MNDEIWLLFDKSFYGKKYGGKTITNKPIKALSFESAYNMFAQGKAVQTKAPNNARAKAEKPSPIEETTEV
jgi:hypothetical protein